LIEQTRSQLAASGAKSVEDIRRLPRRLASFSPQVAVHNGRLKRFLFSHLYSHPAIAEDRSRSVPALDELFCFFLQRPERMPEHYAQLAKEHPAHMVVCDYVAGMTDHFLLRQCHELLGTPIGSAAPAP
jgi:dGTPase